MSNVTNDDNLGQFLHIRVVHIVDFERIRILAASSSLHSTQSVFSCSKLTIETLEQGV